MDHLHIAVNGLRLALEIYGWMHFAAVLFSWIHVDPRNPIVNFVRHYTVPLWHWFEARLSGSMRNFSAYFAILFIFFLQIFLPGAILSLGAMLIAGLEPSSAILSVFAYAGLGAATVISSMVYLLMVLCVVWFIMTLLNPSINNTIVRFVMIMVDPFITPIQRILPRGGIDLSPLVVALMAYYGNHLIAMGIGQIRPFIAV